MPILKPGDAAPAFRLAASGGAWVDSQALSGPYVLVFYPANDTPG